MLREDFDNKHEILKKDFDDKYEIAQQLVRQLAKDKQAETFTGKILRLSYFNKCIYSLGEEILQERIDAIKLVQKGFYVEGEVLSLQLYNNLWNNIIEQQKRLNHALSIDKKNIPPINTNKVYDLRRYIVRAIHSNDINIFLENGNTSYNYIVRDFYEKQSEFISLGGIVERIFLGKGDTANQDYQNAMDSMKSIGIGVHYLQLPTDNKKQFDFAWISTNERNRICNDEIVNYTAKWYSEHNTDKLGMCELSDGVENNVFREWYMLGTRVEDSGESFDKIPQCRQIKNRH